VLHSNLRVFVTTTHMFPGWVLPWNTDFSEPELSLIANMWKSVASYRSIEIHIPAEEVQEGLPLLFTDIIREIVAFLVGTWTIPPIEPSAKPLVTIHLGRLFSEILPFNVPVPVGYGWTQKHLTNWVLELCVWKYPKPIRSIG